MRKCFLKKQRIISNLLLVLICSGILLITKIYIILVLLPTIIIWLFFEFKKSIPFRIQAFVIYPIVIIIAFSIINYFFQNNDQYNLDWLSDKVQTQQENFANIANVTDEGSYFNIGDLDPTPLGVLKKAPMAINATLFRPYIWESKKIVMLISAIESFILLLFSVLVILRVGVFNIINALRKQPIILMCFIFSITFAFAVGITTPNFGTLVRYKIQCMPFYIAMLFMLLDYKKSVVKKRELRSVQ